MSSKILIIGACGQIGSELTSKLRALYGTSQVIASDINTRNLDLVNAGPFEIIDAKNYHAIKDCCLENKVDTIYLMAALLSATGEKYPMEAWDLNTNSLFHVLELARKGIIKKIFWPSSIAVFGPTTPKHLTPQHTIAEPTTVYGITKQVGERWCAYYCNKYQIDVRSLRYPGLISYKTMPGGGTTDYAVEIYHQAILQNRYSCFLSKDTKLPMMFMEDAISGTLDLMHAPANKISIRSAYNIASISITPNDIFMSICKYIPNFKISYKPDFRQHIANSWPNSIDDSKARNDWNWKPKHNLNSITQIMLQQLKLKYQKL